MSMSRLIAGVSLFLLLWGGSAVAGPPVHEAARLVKETADRVISQVRADREALVKNEALIHELVNEVVLPHFDFERMSKWVLGRYWREASPEQRERFEQEFRQLLVKTYATALTEYSDQEIEYLPVRVRTEGEDVLVRTEVRQGGGYTIPISYNMHRNDGRWMVYDVTIEGVSLVSNYRSSFAGQIRSHGIDRLIAMLAERNQSLDR
ncbi:MAG: ABC transporter substrate-binding protein [Gammaproteobacteria bacterium]|nr:ABC transporter substrate-binding protein [Gammaproteobacteria bacterium]